jgi:hypothetical protein
MNSKSSINLTLIVSLVFLYFLSCSNSDKAKIISKTVTVNGFDADIILSVSRKWEAVGVKIGTYETGSGKPERIVIDAGPGLAFVDIDLSVRPQLNKVAEIPRLLSEELVLIDSEGNKYRPQSTTGPYEDKGIKVGSMFEVPDTVELAKLQFGSLEFEINLSLPNTLSK